MAGQDDADGWLTEEIKLPGEDSDARGDDRPSRQGAVRRSPGPDEYPSRLLTARQHARRRRQSLTFLVLFAIILLTGVLSLVAYFGKISLPFGQEAGVAALPPCPAPSAKVLAPSEVNVNVFNASDRNGLALNVARELQKRGFQVPTTPANDPQKTKMTTAAVIRHGASGVDAARTVAGQVKGEVTLTPDDRTSTDVDLVLGPTFELAPAAAASPSPSASDGAAPAASPTPTCAPAD